MYRTQPTEDLRAWLTELTGQDGFNQQSIAEELGFSRAKMNRFILGRSDVPNSPLRVRPSVLREFIDRHMLTPPASVMAWTENYAVEAEPQRRGVMAGVSQLARGEPDNFIPLYTDVGAGGPVGFTTTQLCRKGEEGDVMALLLTQSYEPNACRGDTVFGSSARMPRHGDPCVMILNDNRQLYRRFLSYDSDGARVTVAPVAAAFDSDGLDLESVAETFDVAAVEKICPVVALVRPA